MLAVKKKKEASSNNRMVISKEDIEDSIRIIQQIAIKKGENIQSDFCIDCCHL